MVLGTRDYARKCGFRDAVLGLSGGIDSSLTTAVAVEALGPEHVLGVLMPSPHSSQGSIDDSLALAKNPGHPHRDPCPSPPSLGPLRRPSPWCSRVWRAM